MILAALVVLVWAAVAVGFGVLVGRMARAADALPTEDDPAWLRWADVNVP